jgi:SAM-dependent methyltransferase
MIDASTHWDQRYRTDDTKLSWFEPVPRCSLELIRRAAPARNASIIDVGGGTSRLAGMLLDQGYCDLSVLDVSDVALQLNQAHLGERAQRIHWLRADIAEWMPARQWDVWHDRALFHFLTDEARQEAYLHALTHATARGARAIVAGFALDGPERCSGLPVTRYSPESLAERLGRNFLMKHYTVERHVTPSGAIQRFLYALFERQ